MHFSLIALLLVTGLLAGMLLLLETGRRIGLRQMAKDSKGAHQGLGAVEGAVFGLMGLLIAFTFSGAASRFDARRQLVVEEANDIGTPTCGSTALPAAAQPALREASVAIWMRGWQSTANCQTCRQLKPNWPELRSCRAKSGLRPSPLAGRRPSQPPCWYCQR
jgi:hypothetical protein